MITMWYRMDDQEVVFRFPENERNFFNLSKYYMFSGFCRGLNEIVVLLGCYMAYIGS
jgi:hypothetical protein